MLEENSSHASVGAVAAKNAAATNAAAGQPVEFEFTGAGV
jgi:hypothetical protein